MDFVELHARSAFSFLEGACVPEELAGACTQLGMPAMAIVDRNGVYGATRFHMAAKQSGVRAHIGSEITCTNGVTYPLLAETREGYRNLCRLVTRMKLRARKGEGAATLEELAEFSRGLICLTRHPDERLADIFGRHQLYAELQRHHHRDEEARNQAIAARARSLGIPVVATNAPSYAVPAQRELLDVFTCVRNHVTLAAAGRLLERNAERHVKTPEEMARLFADLPEALANTLEISSRLEFTLADLGYEFPRYPVPDGETMMSFLRQRVDEGARHRYRPYYESARLQIERELALIEKLKLPGYFLIVWDIVRFCRQNDILAQGRGSAANSAVCYALEITAVDPVGMELLFERFLSEERGEWPDIDIDLPSGDKRESAIQYVYQRFGKLGAAMTANVITYRGRSAAREVGKALGFEVTSLDRLAGLVHTFEWKDPKDTSTRQFQDAGLDLEHPRVRKFRELYRMAQDLPRHLGQHSGGMVICQGQLDSVVPLEPATMPGRVVVQWDKEDCADMGIIKVDLLGLGMMAALEDSIVLIRDGYGKDVDLAHLPPDDPAVYATLQKADTVGMFQIESRAQMSCLPRLRPERFYDLVVEVAIIRPGPIVGKMVHPYLKRRQGREPVTYPHPSLEPVLKRTLGVPLFQEQLLRLAMIAAGFTGGEAEELRRAMGFKRSQARMEEIEKKLRRGMAERGITGRAADKIILSITSFALYGFPESHAASFALIAYASAYLKCHYLAAFTAALLNNQPMGFYSPATLVKDAQRHGLKLLPVDVRRSEWKCTLEAVGHQPSAISQSELASDCVAGKQDCVARALLPATGGRDAHPTTGEPAPSEAEGPALRLGLRYVRGLREEAAQALVRERQITSFTSIHDLTRRVPELRKDELTTLAEIGALNAVASSQSPVASKTFVIPTPERMRGAEGSRLCSQLGTRDSGLETCSQLHRRDALWQVERAVRGSGPLLEKLPEPDMPSPLEPMNHEERLVADFHGTGLTVGPHPVAYRRAWLNAMGIRRASELRDIPSGKRLRIGGCVIVRQRPGTAKGFVFVSLEDETGVANAIITPDLFHRNRLLLASEKFLAIEGILQNQDNVISVKAERVMPLFVTKAETVSHDFH